MEQGITICPKCNTPNPVKNFFCQICGNALLTEPQATNLPPSMGTSIPSSYGPPFPQPVSPPPQDIPPQGIPLQSPPPGIPLESPPPGSQVPFPIPPQRIPVKPSINNLGVRIDTYTNVYPGAAEKIREVEAAFIDEMIQHPVPQTRLAPMEFSSGEVEKLFHVIQAKSGSVATNITPIGNDLSIGWTLYAQQKANWKGIGILIGVAFAISLLTSLVLIGDFGRFMLQFIFGSFNWVLVSIAVGMVSGKIIGGNIWHFFVRGPDDFDMQDLEIMAITVQQAVDSALVKAGVSKDCSCDCCKD